MLAPAGADPARGIAVQLKANADDGADDVDFLHGVVQKCKWMGWAQFAMIPLVFALAKLQLVHLVVAVVIFQVMLSFSAQVSLLKRGGRLDLSTR